jgi:hypothetical protein
MTVPEALETVRRAGEVRVENGRIKTRFKETERGRLQPAIDFLRSHRGEALRLLTESANSIGTEGLATLESTGQPTNHDRAAAERELAKEIYLEGFQPLRYPD